MLSLITISLAACTDKEGGVKKSCNGHGKCENEVCTCETGYDSVAGPLCTVCAEGYEVSTEGLDRCINVAACMTGKDNAKTAECYGHGFCTAKDSYDPKTKWYCRCINHFENETGSGLKKEAVNCSVCMTNYKLNEAGTKCLTKECDTTTDLAYATECNGKGFCLDTYSGNKIQDGIIDEIEKLIEEYLGIHIPDPGCICRLNMDANCTACREGYRLYENVTEEVSKCVFDACANPAGECGGKGTCGFDSFNNEYDCTCEKNYQPKTQCTTCIYHFTVDSGCTVCEPGYDIKTECYQCTFGRDEASNCTTCMPGFDIETDCTTCLGGHDPLTRCLNCPAGMVENGQGVCTKANTSGSTAMIVTFSIVGGLAVLIGGAVLTIYCMRKKRAATVDLDEQEGFAQ